DAAAPFRLNHDFPAGLRPGQHGGQSERGFRARVAARNDGEPATSSEIRYKVSLRDCSFISAPIIKHKPAARGPAESPLSLKCRLVRETTDPRWTGETQHGLALLKACGRLSRFAGRPAILKALEHLQAFDEPGSVD